MSQGPRVNQSLDSPPPPAAITHDLVLAVAPLPIAEKHDENAWRLFCVSEPRRAMSFESKYRPTAASKLGDHMHCQARETTDW